MCDGGMAVRYLILARDLIMSQPALAVIIRSVDRMMAREVMLFAGGVSFFGLLALFPAFAVGASLYGIIFDTNDAQGQVARIAEVLPPSAESFLINQTSHLTEASNLALSFQGLVAAFISMFAAARGAKALIAGLNQIARRGDLRNILHFNLLAMIAVILGGTLVALSNIFVIAVPNLIEPILNWAHIEFELNGVFSPWTAAAFSMVTALSLLYRYVMQRAGETSWFASLVSAFSATTLWLAISKGFAIYVSTIVHPTAYGSLGALIVFLLWVYWASYAVFFGGALAVEIDVQRGYGPNRCSDEIED